ncbi:MAG: hypothetical protein JNM20_08215 [Rhizobiales bacterium]|nr:hypothetical protein [Hyphomicrobiales bacterium]
MKTGQLAGAVILSIVFGSLHAFSVLALPLQHAFAASRAGVSLGYALALSALTVAVYLAPAIMRRLTPAGVAIACAALAATGLLIAGSALGLISFLAGFGAIFGFANGVAYSLFLDRAAAALAGQKGLAIGLVTATYGGGAAVFAPILDAATAVSSVFMALMMLGLVVFLGGLVASWLFRGSRFAIADRGMPAETPRRWMLVMWAVYFCGVFGGLMLLAHAAPLLEWQFAGTSLTSLAVMLVALGNIAGSVGGGYWGQISSPRHALALPIVIGIFATVLLLVSNDRVLSLAALAAAGLSYGALIAAIPVVVVTSVGASGFAHAFGRIFSAWGLAGLAGPPLAGVLFDYSAAYDSALLVALSMSCAGLVLTLFVPHRHG